MTTVLVQSLNKRHMKYVFHNKFRKIFHDQKTLSLNFKSNLSQIFFEISVLNYFAIFTRKRLCRNYFLIELQACRSEILLKRDSSTDVFLEYCKIFRNTYFLEHLQTVASVLPIIKLVISTGHLATFSS